MLRIPGVPGRHTAPDSPSKPSQAAAAAEAALERRAAALADRHRAMRKRAKKLRLRLANASGPVAWVRDDDARSGAVPECDREVGCAPLPACVEAAKPRLVSLTSAVAKRKQDAMSVAHKEVNVALAEAARRRRRRGARKTPRRRPAPPRPPPRARRGGHRRPRAR